MIIRAAFFIGLVMLLAPHEPDLGLGRPSAFTGSGFTGAGAWLPSPNSVLSAAGLSRLGQVCNTCAGGRVSLPSLDQVPAINLAYGGRSLSQVKGEIEAAIRERHARGG